MHARVVSVNVGVPRDVEWQGRVVTSAIWKTPTSERVRVAGVNLAGDDQADRRVHGGVDKAVYAYAVEDYAWWAQSVEVGPAAFGENLTTEGIDLRTCAVGDRWQVGTVTFEVAQPREPCFKLGMRMSDEHFPGRFEEARRPGAYLRIVTAGELGAGDTIAVTETGAPRVCLGDMVGTLDRATWRVIALDDRFPEGWQRRAERALRREQEQ
jgi:MOSC domain-containing protein YiiM